jgi:hypothetical protein
MSPDDEDPTPMQQGGVMFASFMYGARFRQRFTLDEAIEFSALLRLKPLPSVRPMSFLLGVHSSYRLAR